MNSLAVFEFDCSGSTVRSTEDRRFSVYDVLVAFGVADKPSNAKNVYDRLAASNLELTTICSKFKFPGRGQRDTPVATEEGIYQILMLCPGQRGAEFRVWAARLTGRFLLLADGWRLQIGVPMAQSVAARIAW
jgi:prophage antirepressor-like protein